MEIYKKISNYQIILPVFLLLRDSVFEFLSSLVVVSLDLIDLGLSTTSTWPSNLKVIIIILIFVLDEEKNIVNN